MQEVLTLYDVRDEHHLWHRGRLERIADFWDQVEQRVLSRLETLRGRDVSYAEFLARHARDLPARVRTLATAFVEGFNTADRGLISARGLHQAQQAGIGPDAHGRGDKSAPAL